MLGKSSGRRKVCLIFGFIKISWDVHEELWGFLDMGEGSLGMTRLSACLVYEVLKLAHFENRFFFPKSVKVAFWTNTICWVVQVSY